MSALPKYAINTMGTQVHTDREPSRTAGGILYFMDGTTCAPAARDAHGNADIRFAEPATDAYLTPEAAQDVMFVSYDSMGAMTTTHGGGKFKAMTGDPQRQRGVSVGDDNVQHNIFPPQP